MTTNDGDWVQDVKRWYFSAGRAGNQNAAGTPVTPQHVEVGYEAAQPTLHPAKWSTPKRTEFGSLR